MDYNSLKRFVFVVLGMLIVVEVLDLFVFHLGIDSTLVYMFFVIVSFEVGLWICRNFLE